MPQEISQRQTLKTAQVQRATQQQLLNARLLELPIEALQEKVNDEMDNNPALERDYDAEKAEQQDNYDAPEQRSQEETDREEAFDEALKDMASDDEMPQPYGGNGYADSDQTSFDHSDTVSFYDQLNEQMNMEQLTPTEHDIMEYLIGSLDDDGLLRKDLSTIADELAIYHNIDVDEKTVEGVLHKLQRFDPAGIGARNLQECLLLQIQRRPAGRLKDLMTTVVKDHFDEFTKKHWDKISASMQLSDLQSATLFRELTKLTPKPGSPMSDTVGVGQNQVTPDFIVDTADDGTVTFEVNYGDVPDLKISDSFAEMIDTYRTNKKGMTRSDKEALQYTEQKVAKAKSFIEAVKQRRRTMTLTMQAIINWQLKFFQDGDEADLKPMILSDIAEKTGLDISTVSRVCQSKYAQTRWGIFPLKHFLVTKYTTDEGEQLSTRKMKLELKDIIDHEDKKHPLSDNALMKMMNDRKYPISRRTVTKYREQMRIPVARLRK